MADKRFILDLGKLVIAAAWVDGSLSPDELSSLKDLVYSLPDVTGADWTELELYLDAPVGDEERRRLLENVLSRVRSREDKALVLDVLSRLVEADGVVTDEERMLLDEVGRALEDKSTGVLAALSAVVGGAVRSRDRGYRAGANREARLDDYLKNTVYFQLVSEMEARGEPFTLSEEEVRRVCLAGGLLAHVAWIDENVTDEEKRAISAVLQAQWGVPKARADLIAAISVTRVVKGVDYYRLTRGFFESTSLEERRAFLETLFQVANAAGKTSNEEIEEIRRIASSLKLTNRDFVQAKLTVPREDRGGL